MGQSWWMTFIIATVVITIIEVSKFPLCLHISRCQIDFLADIIHLIDHEVSEAQVLPWKTVHSKVPHFNVDDWYDWINGKDHLLPWAPWHTCSTTTRWPQMLPWCLCLWLICLVLQSDLSLLHMNKHVKGLSEGWSWGRMVSGRTWGLWWARECHWCTKLLRGG